MIPEHDVVKLKRNIKTIDWEGEQVSLPAGEEGTVMYSTADVPECLVEFGHTATDAFMVIVKEEDLESIWSPNQPGNGKLVS
jgi:hypothetical protein